MRVQVVARRDVVANAYGAHHLVRALKAFLIRWSGVSGGGVGVLDPHSAHPFLYGAVIARKDLPATTGRTAPVKVARRTAVPPIWYPAPNPRRHIAGAKGELRNMASRLPIATETRETGLYLSELVLPDPEFLTVRHLRALRGARKGMETVVAV